MPDPDPLLVDPEVSRAKFGRELARYRELEDTYIRRGWWMLGAEFPEVFVVFATARVKPPSVVFGAILNFTNYDFWPPSVKVVDPFTRIPYLAKDVPVQLKRRVPAAPEVVAQFAARGMIVQHQEQAMMQAHDSNDVPFLCLPGVREYHDHPGHSGDPWLLHRSRGEGTLHFVLEQLSRYGVEPIRGYQLGIQCVINGYQGEVPE